MIARFERFQRVKTSITKCPILELESRLKETPIGGIKPQIIKFNAGGTDPKWRARVKTSTGRKHAMSVSMLHQVGDIPHAQGDSAVGFALLFPGPSQSEMKKKANAKIKCFSDYGAEDGAYSEYPPRRAEFGTKEFLSTEFVSVQSIVYAVRCMPIRLHPITRCCQVVKVTAASSGDQYPLVAGWGKVTGNLAIC